MQQHVNKEKNFDEMKNLKEEIEEMVKSIRYETIHSIKFYEMFVYIHEDGKFISSPQKIKYTHVINNISHAFQNQLFLYICRLWETKASYTTKTNTQINISLKKIHDNLKSKEFRDFLFSTHTIHTNENINYREDIERKCSETIRLIEKYINTDKKGEMLKNIREIRNNGIAHRNIYSKNKINHKLHDFKELYKDTINIAANLDALFFGTFVDYAHFSNIERIHASRFWDRFTSD